LFKTPSHDCLEDLTLKTHDAQSDAQVIKKSTLKKLRSDSLEYEKLDLKNMKKEADNTAANLSTSKRSYRRAQMNETPLLSIVQGLDGSFSSMTGNSSDIMLSSGIDGVVIPKPIRENILRKCLQH
jgi:hypothetical protein